MAWWGLALVNPAAVLDAEAPEAVGAGQDAVPDAVLDASGAFAGFVAVPVVSGAFAASNNLCFTLVVIGKWGGSAL